MAKIKFSNIDSTVITGATEITTPADADQILVYDASDGAMKKMQRGNFIFQTPAVSSISPTLIDPDGSTTTTVSVTGVNIEDGFTATWVGNDGTVYTPGATTFTNSTSITVDTTATMTAANSPYDLKIVNGNGIIASATNILTLNNPPVFTTAAGSLGNVQPGSTDFSGLSSPAATDPDSDTVTHTISAGALPTGMTLSTSGTFGGTVSDPLSDQTFTFTVQAATTHYTITRQFTIELINVSFITATGGTENTLGDFKWHTFTADGIFSVSQAAVGPPAYPNNIDYFVQAGGGGGNGDHPGAFENGAGAGAGGFRLSNSDGPLGPFASAPLANPVGYTLSASGDYPITVGSGGTGNDSGGNGSPSVFSNITSTGGGGGPRGCGQPGGSGGGSLDNKPVGIGNTPPVSPPQGNNGGLGPSPPRGTNMGGGGGGGAGGAGGNGQGGGGGAASYVPNDWLGPNAPNIGYPGPSPTNRYFAGGSGGAGGSNGGGGGASAGNGGSNQSASPTTGSGASSSTGYNPTTTGGSGVVVLRYKYQ